MTTTPRAWLAAFVAAIRANDLEAGRALFANDVVGFGVIAARVTDLDELVTRQWAPTWSQAARWDVDSVELEIDADDLAVVAFTWSRTNLDATVVSGRASVVLRLEPDGTWRCVHSHLSANP